MDCLALHIFQYHRVPLPDTDAQGHEGIAIVRAHQLLGSGQQQARTGHAQWVPQRNRTALRVEAGIKIIQTQRAGTGQRLRGEGLVELNQVHVA